MAVTLPFCMWYITPNAKATSEQRTLAAKPQFDIQRLDHYVDSAAEFYNDHFPLRDQLLPIYHEWSSEIVPSLFNPNKKWIEGKNGWLYLSKEREQIMEEGTLTEVQLERMGIELTKRKEYLEEKGCQYFIVFVPCKTTMYPENLPFAIDNSNGNNQTDQLVNHLQSVTNLEVLDLRKVMNLPDSIHHYQLTDTHWNDLGAFMAYQETYDFISRKMNLSRRLEMEDFQYNKQTKWGWQHCRDDRKHLCLPGDHAGVGSEKSSHNHWRRTRFRTLPAIRISLGI